MNKVKEDLTKTKKEIETEPKYLHSALRKSKTLEEEDIYKREMDFLQEISFDLDLILHKEEKGF